MTRARYFLGLILILALLAFPGMARAVLMEASGTQSTSQDLSISRTYTFFGATAFDVGVYIPFYKTTGSYDTYWTQTATHIVSSTPRATETFQDGLGVWLFFGNVTNQSITVTIEGQVSVNVNLTGISSDVAASSFGSEWCRPTVRIPNGIAGLNTTINNLWSASVAGTRSDTRSGFLERWSAWLDQNVRHMSGGSYEDQAADRVYSSLSGNCSGFSNLFKSGCLVAPQPMAVGICGGWTFNGNSTWRGSKYQLTFVTYDGPHEWVVVDGGSNWIPYDPFHNLIGMVTATRALEFVAEDESNASDIVSFSYTGASGPIVSISDFITRRSPTKSDGFSVERERNPFPSHDYIAQYYSAASLRPTSDGYPVTGVDENPIVDRSKANTIRVWPNPAVQRVESQVYLERDAHVWVGAFNASGQLVDTLLDAERGAGYNYLVWHVADVPAGVYFLRMRFNAGTDEQSTTQKVVISH